MSRPRRRQNSSGSNGSVTIVNINSRRRIKQLSTGSANSGRNNNAFWNGIDEEEYHAQTKTNIKVPSSRRRNTKQASSSSSEEVSGRVHDGDLVLPSAIIVEDAQQFKNKGQEEENTAAVDPIIESPSHCDKKRSSPFWKYLFRKGG
jgi:hypothetical protein